MNERVVYVGAVTGRLRRDDTAYADQLLRVTEAMSEDVMDLPHGERISLSEMTKAERNTLWCKFPHFD